MRPGVVFDQPVPSLFLKVENTYWCCRYEIDSYKRKKTKAIVLSIVAGHRPRHGVRGFKNCLFLPGCPGVVFDLPGSTVLSY